MNLIVCCVCKKIRKHRARGMCDNCYSRFDYQKNKERYHAYYQRPEVKERRKQYNQRPEVKERRKQYNQRPEVKERIRAYKKSRYNPQIKIKNRKAISCRRKESTKNNVFDLLNLFSSDKNFQQAVLMDGKLLNKELEKKGIIKL